MELETININGYKSIDNITIPVKKINGSSLITLLGKNESGKSNILEAINVALFKNKEKYNFGKISNRILHPKKIIISSTYDISKLDINNTLGSKNLHVDKTLINKLGITKLTDIYTMNEDGSSFEHSILLNHNMIEVNSYYVRTTQSSPNNGATSKRGYEIVHENNLAPFGTTGYKQLDSLTLDKLLQDALLAEVEERKSGGLWNPNNEYLLPEQINLKEFAEDPSKCIPLKNIFALHGEKDKNSIQTTIKSINASTSSRRTLGKQLSKKANDFLREKWKEINVKIDINIESTLITSINIVDEQNEDAFYAMEERSQGFKSFVSLLLSVSIDNFKNQINDAFIIIDEPETHLHPSGARWLLSELLKIGENNNIIIATHSNFLIDKQSKTRHFITEKDSRGITNIIQVKDTDSILGDEVLDRAFGIDPIRDFISKNQIIVEGLCDKRIISKALKYINQNFERDTKIINGVGNNIQALASFSILHDISPLVITDDDTQGRADKNKIKQISNDYEDKVFTIRDLNQDLPSGSTIEDCVSFKKLQEIASKQAPSLAAKINTMREDVPFLIQLTNLLKESNKKEEVEKIINNVKKSVTDIEVDSTDKRLINLGKAIIEKLGTSSE